VPLSDDQSASVRTKTIVILSVICILLHHSSSDACWWRFVLFRLDWPCVLARSLNLSAIDSVLHEAAS